MFELFKKLRNRKKVFSGSYWTFTPLKGWDLIKFKVGANTIKEVDMLLSKSVKNYQYICTYEVSE